MTNLGKQLFLYSLSSLLVVANTVSVESKISNTNDDAEETLASGYVNPHSTDLELIQEYKQQTVGLRFQNIAIPKGATITKAYIQFQVDETSAVTTNLIIHGQKSVNAGAFDKSKKRDISGRSKTDAFSSWVVPVWNEVGVRGDAQKSSDLSSIVQEIIDLDGWQAGNALAFIVSGTGKRVAESYEGDALGAPLLHIEYATETVSDNNDSTTGTLPNGEATLIKRASTDTTLKDLEALSYSASDNALWVADDDGKQIYNINLATQQTEEIVRGFDALVPHSNIKAVAYDINSDTLYAFARNNRTIFRLTKDNNGKFIIKDFKHLDSPVVAATFINGELYVSCYGQIRTYDYESNTLSSHKLFSLPYTIEDMAYADDILWAVTENNHLHKIEFSSMHLLDSYDLASYGLKDARGVEVIADKLYIGEGADQIGNGLEHAIYILNTSLDNAEGTVSTKPADTTAPIITLNGERRITLTIGEHYSELGATAEDEVDGSVNVFSSGQVDSSSVGIYTVTYTATDSASNQAKTTRTITVISDGVDNPPPVLDPEVIKRDPSDTNLKDIEAISYVASDHALWVADDDKKQIYKINLDTQRTEEVIDTFNALKGGSDIKAIAYDSSTETMYVFGRENKTVFKLRKNNQGIFTVVDFKPLTVAVVAATVIDNKLYVSHMGIIQEYDYDSNQLGKVVLTSPQLVYDMAYDNGILWMVTGDNRLHKVDFASKSTLKTYSMEDRGIHDARGVEVVDNKLYIADGADNLTGDLAHAIYILDIDLSTDNSNSNMRTSLRTLEVIKRDFQNIPFRPERADMEAIAYIPSDHAIWITNDDGKHFIYRLNLNTNKVDDYVDGFVQGFDVSIKAQDLEAIAYDAPNDTLYVASGTCGRDTAIFKLARTASGSFEIVDAHKVDEAFTSMIFIDNQLYVAYKGRELKRYDFETKQLSDTLYRSQRELYDMVYADGILWVTTDEKRLVKIDWESMETLDSFDMKENAVEDPRGVAVVDNKLYISDGADWVYGDLRHAMHVFAMP